jgi:hypothetical protein
MDAQNATTPPCRTVVNADELHGERYYSSLSLTELSLFIKACEVARRSGNRHGSHGLVRLVANPGLRGLTDDAGSGGLPWYRSTARRLPPPGQGDAQVAESNRGKPPAAFNVSQREGCNSRHGYVTSHILDSYVARNMPLTRRFSGPRGIRTHNPRIKRATLMGFFSISRQLD